MRVFNLLYSTIKPRSFLWAAAILFICASGCTEDNQSSPDQNLDVPYGNPQGSAEGIIASGSGGSPATPITTVDSGTGIQTTGGVGGTAPVRPVDAGNTVPFDSGTGDGSTGVVDTGVAPTDSAVVDSGKGAADATPTDTAVADSSGGTGDSGNAANSPCPTNGDPCKILPFGDSITFGMGSSTRGGYRDKLFKKALADGKNITFVGSQRTGPTQVDGVSFPQNHEGHSGWIISQIAALVPSPALDGDPHIILLMIGTNDVSWAGTRNPGEQLASLVDNLMSISPDALIVVAQITPLGSGDDRAQAYNADMPAIIDERAAQGANIMLVDMHTGYGMTWYSDGMGVHPDDQGYDFMADVWYAAIKDVLP